MSLFAGPINHFEEESKKLRAGRPSPDQFSAIEVEAYGSMSPLNTVANITVVDATLVTVQPYDKNLVEDTAKAIQNAGLNYNPQINGDLIRIPIPPLTQEKRAEIIKKVKQLSEEAKISVRQLRKAALDKIDRSQKGGEISEDEARGQEKSLQKEVDAANLKIDEIAATREQALAQV